MNALISVVIPVYNADKYLKQCLDSILAQTLNGLEIIIVDDGSTDMCPSIIDEYAQNHDNIVVIHQSQQGVIKARIAGCKVATADYIGFVDSDDFIDPTMYERLYEAAVVNQADFVGCDYSFYPEKVPNKEKWFKKYDGKVDWYFIERNTQSWNKIVARELFDKTNALDLWVESGEGIYVKLLLHAKRIVMIPEELYHYRVGHTSISGGGYRDKTSWYVRVAKTTKKQIEFLEGTQYKETLQDYFRYRYIYSLIQVCVVAAFNGMGDVYKWAKTELRKENYKKNCYLNLILKNNHGCLKAFILREVIPSTYFIANLVTKAIFR